MGVGAQNLVVELVSLVEPVLQNEELDVIPLDLGILGVGVMEQTVFRGGFVEIAGGEIKVAEHAVAFGVIRNISLGLLQKGFGLGPLALGHQKPHQCRARCWVLRIVGNGAFEYLLRFRDAIAGLIEAAKRQLSIHPPRIKVSRFLEVDVSLVGQVGAQLQQRQVKIGLGTVGIEGDAFLHLLYSGSDIILSGVVVSPGLISLWVVGLLVAEHVKMRSCGLQVLGLAGNDQHVRDVDTGRIIIG